MTILPLTYLGGTEWFTRLLRGDCVIDIGENWVKQTARNRCEIATASGVATLTVPVHGGRFGGASGGGASSGGTKIPTRDVRIDNSKRWQHNHWISIVSAYRNSPFFDHYEERFAPLYARKYDFLVDLNLELLDVVLAALGVGGGVGASTGDVCRPAKILKNSVVASPEDVDLRGKKALRRQLSETDSLTENGNNPADEHGNNSATEHACSQQYTQVFSDRMAFEPGLSIADLLFCEGPTAAGLLRRWGGC
ncbi:MAG: WbqC family protein [Alistipes sp.]|jgi:hypothetical protein|nr:WbqC family protein [Alistipes sp.]